jgi:CRISPR/Cas system-associated exonuclease Cas4 (RecB family)
LDSSLQAIKDLMERGYPDCSDLTFIVSAERGRGFVQNFAHRSVGGILPSFKSYDEYKAEVLSQKMGLKRLERSEELVYLVLFLLRKKPGAAENAGVAAFNMLPAMRYARLFSLERENLKNLKGIRKEQEDKIDELFDTMIEFDRFLEGLGMFMPVLREQEFLEHLPAEKDFFVNLPLLTPVSRTFYRKIPPERKLVDIPVYADGFKGSRPDYPSSLNLVSEARIPLTGRCKPGLSFHELRGKASIPAYLRRSIADFLAEGEGGDQIFILLLDETLSFYLWQTVFKELGSRVNFSPGIPLSITSAGARVSQFIEQVDGRPRAQDFSRFRAGLASELYSHRNDYVREEQWAMEAAIDFVARLEKYAEPLGPAFRQVAGLLLQQRQFFLQGERSAPVQIVGLGETTGAPFARGIIVPLNSDVFPSRVYNGPFLNFIHTPQIKNAHLEMEDLALRQFMSFGTHLDIVSVLDEAKDMTPSFFFTFLKNEFAQSVTNRSVPTVSARSEDPAPFIENDRTVREKILAHSFSFTSLSHILTCPFGFYLTHIEKVAIPDFMREEDNTNQILGSFVHEFFNRLAGEAKPLETWKAVFEELWAKSPDVAGLEGKAIFRLVLLGQIGALAEQEIKEENPLVFDNSARVTEKKFQATFGGAVKFKLNGRLDAFVERGGTHTILDYKYKSRPDLSSRPLAESLSGSRSVDPRLQIGLYSYLLAEALGVAPGNINGCFVYIREEDPGKRIYRLERADIESVADTMNVLSERLEQILSQDRLEPNHRAINCRNCLLKSLCKPENFFRKSAR